jgi:hypothetical protein
MPIRQRSWETTLCPVCYSAYEMCRCPLTILLPMLRRGWGHVSVCGVLLSGFSLWGLAPEAAQASPRRHFFVRNAWNLSYKTIVPIEIWYHNGGHVRVTSPDGFPTMVIIAQPIPFVKFSKA